MFSHPRLPSRARHPDWSPDGEWQDYGLDGPGDATAIWVSRIDGSDARRLVDCRAPCGFADDPAWSVDGTNIAYWRNGDDELQAIHVLDVESGEESLIAVRGAPGEGPIRPRWSPDGTKLVVEIEQYSDDGEYLASGTWASSISTRKLPCSRPSPRASHSLATQIGTRTRMRSSSRPITRNTVLADRGSGPALHHSPRRHRPTPTDRAHCRRAVHRPARVG